MNKLALYMGTTLMSPFVNLSNIAVAATSNSDILGDLNSGDRPENLSTNVISEVIWVFIALGIVIALLVFALRWLSKRNRAWGAQKGMRSLGGIALGQQASLQVIELGGRIYIVGVGDQVTLIDKEDDPVKVAQLIQELEQKEQLNVGFPSIREWLTSKSKTSAQQQAMSKEDQGMWKQSNSFEELLQTKLTKQAERKQELESLLKDNNK